MNTATEAQVALINRLKDERDLSRTWDRTTDLPEDRASVAAKTGLDMLRLAWTENRATRQVASIVINYLLEAPKRLDAEPVAEVEEKSLEGMHRLDGVIYKVQRAVHGSGRLYAKELVTTDTTCGGCETCDGEDICLRTDVRFEYASGMIRRLSEATRLTLEEAKAFGALYGSCCVCAKTLTNEDSIEAGIGPVCSKVWA